MFLAFCSIYCSPKKDEGLKPYIVKEYYSDGSLKRDWLYVDSLPNGETITYYPSGKVQSTINYINGKISGPAIFYYESGAIRAKSNFLDDKSYGEGIQYYENGIVLYKGNYYNNHRVGEHFEYYENGKVKEVGEYIIYDTANQLNAYIYYAPDGSVTKKSATLKFDEGNGILKIKVDDKTFENVRFILGNFDKYFVLDGIESLDTVNSKDNSTLQLTYHKGDTVRGFVDNYKLITKDSGASKYIWFSYPRPW